MIVILLLILVSGRLEFVLNWFDFESEQIDLRISGRYILALVMLLYIHIDPLKTLRDADYVILLALDLLNPRSDFSSAKAADKENLALLDKWCGGDFFSFEDAEFRLVDLRHRWVVNRPFTE